MSYKVLLTHDAAKDLDEIFDSVHLNDSPGSAEYVLNQIENAIDSLSHFPERGSYPDEVINPGIKHYREVYFKPYRLVSQIIKTTVCIMLLVDGRRDKQTLLSRRLLDV